MKKEELIGKDTFVLLYTSNESTLIHASRLNDDIAKHLNDETPIIVDLETDDYNEAIDMYNNWIENK